MIQQIKKSETIISKISKSKAQQAFITHLFVVWLRVQGRHNIKNTSRYSEYNERTHSNWMGRSFDFAEFHDQSVAPQLAQSTRRDWILAGDCSFIPKSGKQTYGKGSFWSGSISQSVSGLEIEAYALINPLSKEAYMVDVEQTPGQLSSKEGGQEDYTRVDHYVNHLKRVLRRYYWVRYVVLDGYYTKDKVLNFFYQQQDYHQIGKLRKDADLYFYVVLDRKHPKEPKKRSYLMLGKGTKAAPFTDFSVKGDMLNFQ